MALGIDYDEANVECHICGTIFVGSVEQTSCPICCPHCGGKGFNIVGPLDAARTHGCRACFETGRRPKPRTDVEIIGEPCL